MRRPSCATRARERPWMPARGSVVPWRSATNLISSDPATASPWVEVLGPTGLAPPERRAEARGWAAAIAGEFRGGSPQDRSGREGSTRLPMRAGSLHQRRVGGGPGCRSVGGEGGRSATGAHRSPCRAGATGAAGPGGRSSSRSGSTAACGSARRACACRSARPRRTRAACRCTAPRVAPFRLRSARERRAQPEHPIRDQAPSPRRSRWPMSSSLGTCPRRRVAR